MFLLMKILNTGMYVTIEVPTEQEPIMFGQATQS